MIKADIKFISEKKENFFTKLFNSKKLRLEALRKEEVKALDDFLLQTNIEFKELACQSLGLLQNIQLQFKVRDYAKEGRNSHSDEWTGQIDINGHAYCNRVPKVISLGFEKYTQFGKIDHFGKININTDHLSPGLFQIISSFTVKIENGFLLLESKEVISSLKSYNVIETIGCDPFKGNEKLRKEYLETRKKLFQILNQHKVKI